MHIEINTNKKWKRSTNGYVAGVCQGLAESFQINPNLLRVIWLISVFAFGTGIFLYLLLALLLPNEEKLSEYQEDKILGVCRRISERTGVELPLIRVLTVVSALSSLGLTAILYVVLHFALDNSNKKITL